MSRGARIAVAGALVWALFVAAGLGGRIADFGILEAFLAFAPLVVVPLALQVRRRAAGSDEAPAIAVRLERAVGVLVLPGALFTTASLALPPGRVAALVASPWLLVCGLIALEGAVRAASIFGAWKRSAREGVDRAVPAAVQVLLVAGALYLPVGAVWLALSRLGVPIAGFLLPIPILTGLHFHYTAFALPSLAAATGRALHDARRADPVRRSGVTSSSRDRGEDGVHGGRGESLAPAGSRRTGSRALFAFVAAALVLGPGLLAAGWILQVPGLKLAAIILIAAGTMVLAGLVLALSKDVSPRSARWLLRLSGVSVVAGMALAVLYGAGELFERAWISIPQMARLHGVINAIGFTLCGLVGWIRAEAHGPVAARASAGGQRAVRDPKAALPSASAPIMEIERPMAEATLPPAATSSSTSGRESSVLRRGGVAGVRAEPNPESDDRVAREAPSRSGAARREETTMRIAITGGTGFVGRHLARALSGAGHEVVLVARGADRRDDSVLRLPGVHFTASDLSDPDVLARAFEGCDAVAHCAGINREIGPQTYRRVHVDGTRHVVDGARRAGVPKIVLLSFLRARPDCGSPYHESKWEAEEIVRGSGLDYTVLKPGVIYGRGDHMLDHLSHALHSFPVFGLVGMTDRPVRPLAVEDLVLVLSAALTRGRLSRRTVAITGPEQMPLGEAVRRVARVVGRRPLFVRLPVAFHRVLAWLLERVMTIPLVSRAQVQILSEGLVEPAGVWESVPADLLPTTRFTDDAIRRGLPDPGGFSMKDLRCCA